MRRKTNCISCQFLPVYPRKMEVLREQDALPTPERPGSRKSPHRTDHSAPQVFQCLRTSHLPHSYAKMPASLNTLKSRSLFLSVLSALIILHSFRVLCQNTSKRFCPSGPNTSPALRATTGTGSHSATLTYGVRMRIMKQNI